MVDEEHIENVVGDRGRSFGGTGRCKEVATALGATPLGRRTPMAASLAETSGRLQWEVSQLALLHRVVEGGAGQDGCGDRHQEARKGDYWDHVGRRRGPLRL